MENENVDLGLRNFIKKLGFISGGAVALSTAPWLTSCSKAPVAGNDQRKARIGLIGTGSRGQYHIHNFLNLRNAELVALCDNYDVNLEAAHALLPSARVYSDYRQLLDCKDIDGVVIATPLGTHARITLDSLQAGKHVFCEKAMALTMDECREVYDYYKSHDNVLYYCMQRMYDEKYVTGMKMIRDGLIGDIVGMRCHWFRNADWRRPVPSPELERKINWRLYRENSAGLMTELGCHQLEVCLWATGKMPSKVAGFGDIVFWKDGREVYDSVSLTYSFEDGRKIAYESLISNKYNGMEEQILGHKGTMDLTKGLYYLEEDNDVYGMRQLMENIKTGVLSSVPTAGPSWRPEYKSEYIPHAVLPKGATVVGGESMIGATNDGSDVILEAFCDSCITGEKARDVVEEAYCSTILCLLGNEAMEQQTVLSVPDEYKIPYMKF